MRHSKLEQEILPSSVTGDTVYSPKAVPTITKTVKGTGRKRKQRNMEDLFSLLSQVKEKVRSLQTRLKNVEQFTAQSTWNHDQSMQNVSIDLFRENQTGPLVEEFHEPLLETEELTTETIRDWFSSSIVEIH